MKLSKQLVAPPFHHEYIDSIEGDDLVFELKNSIKRLQSIPIHEWEKLHQCSYFPGKWSLNEVIQHIIDTERIMCYRALTFARLDLLELPGFNEDAYATLSHANDRPVSDLVEELVSVRIGTYFLFKSFSPKAINTVGKVNGNDFSVRSIGFIIAGHELHHFEMIKKAYLPLLDKQA
ncbi:MAG TPA: DinB family protein [Chitinophagales bacterium]|nr:DinB family protein [Chitinophagales bacterium]